LGLIEFLFETSRLPSATAQVIQLRAVHNRVTLNHNFIEARGTQQESALNANTVASHAANGKGGLVSTLAQADDGALELLDTLAVAFFNADVHANGIARTELGNIWVYWGFQALHDISHFVLPYFYQGNRFTAAFFRTRRVIISRFKNA